MYRIPDLLAAASRDPAKGVGRTLDHFGVPPREKDEVLAALAAHKGYVTEGLIASA
jgi:hypothetical protein